MSRKHNEYFEGFKQLVAHSCEAADYLKATLKNFAPGHIAECMDSLHEIEHSADHKKHELMKKLVKEFVTPIEREDIIRLTDEIDDVTDAIEDVLMRMYMYNILEIRPEALAFADLIVRCCKALRVVVDELPNFNKSTTIYQAIIDVNTLEEEGDELYKNAMRRLYTDESDPIKVIAWSEMFEKFEYCCDACEDVAGVVETVIMKNS